MLPAQKIYTTGYASNSIDELSQLVTALDAVLIDIRFNSLQVPLRWTGDYLELLLKRRYLHIPQLGVRTFRDHQSFAIQNLQLGIKIIQRLGVNCLLMCECREFENCHRRLIFDELRKQHFSVKEIADWEIADWSKF